MSVSARTLRLAALLSTDEHRSGEDIAAALACSRAAVWKQVGQLRALGIPVSAIPGRGYRLEQPLELLDPEPILACVGASARARLAGLRVVAEIDSTNAELLRWPAADRHGQALLAELQHGGRGRRGRRWHSPFARNVYLSLGWRFDDGLAGLSCLPLVVALAAGIAVERAGVQGLGIKWPNDLVLAGAKLGGCLVEVQGDPQGPCHAVMGVGVNVRMRGAADTAVIDRAWTDLASHAPTATRNAVAGLLLDALLDHLPRFEREGFGPFRADWERRDVLRGRTVTVNHARGAHRGVARGVGVRGGLLVESEGSVVEHLAGEATLGALPGSDAV